mgnify:FL=1
MKINFGSKFDKQCSDMIEVCLKAMSKVMEYYKNGFDVEIKSDNSPVTDADKQSDLIIKSFLKEKFPTYAFLTEESNDDKSRLNEKYVFIIDPLDGTKDFVAKDDMFAINIALVEEHTPVVGVVGIPAQNKIYFAIKDYGSYLLENDALKRIYASDRTDNLIMSCSVFHSGKTDQEIFDKFQNRILKKHPLGSALKSCLIAEGKVDCCFSSSGNTKEWDTCAPQIIVEESGGHFTTFYGDKIIYNREDVYNRNGYAAYNASTENNLSVQLIESKK